MAGRIAIVAPRFPDFLFSAAEAELRRRGHVVTRSRTRDEFLADDDALKQTDVVVAGGFLFTREIMTSMPRLRAIMSPITGTEAFDVKAATELRIVIGMGQTAENVESMAESAVLFMLAALYDLHAVEDNLKRNLPHPTEVTGRMLQRKMVGLIGFGQIARAIVKRLAGWDVRIQTYTPRVRNPLPPEVVRVELDQLLRTSDIVVVLASLNEETRWMLNSERLGLIRRDAVLINLARGGIIDETALYRLAKEGRIGKVALDVFEVEPLPPDSPLRQLPNAILTPHMIGHTQESLASLPSALIENVTRVIAGEPPLYFRNPEVLPRWRDRVQGIESSSNS